MKNRKVLYFLLVLSLFSFLYQFYFIISNIYLKDYKVVRVNYDKPYVFSDSSEEYYQIGFIDIDTKKKIIINKRFYFLDQAQEFSENFKENSNINLIKSEKENKFYMEKPRISRNQIIIFFILMYVIFYCIQKLFFIKKNPLRNQ